MSESEEKPDTPEEQENAENELKEKQQIDDKKSKTSEGKNIEYEPNEKPQNDDKKSKTSEGKNTENELNEKRQNDDKRTKTPEEENAENELREKQRNDDKKTKTSEGKNTKNEVKGKPQNDKKSKTREGEKRNKEKQNDDKQEQIYKEETYHKPKCNMRIEELAKPNKNQVRTVYTEYKHVLPKRNVQVVNEYLKEEYAKTPEDAEQIFKKLRRNEKESECRNVCENEAKKKHTEKINDKKRQKMLDILADVLKRHMLKAHSNPKQIIMTNRLRNLSNMVLKQLCEIRNINVPHRESTSIRATLMYAVSDYFAFCLNTIYYEMQLKKIKDYEELKPLPEQKRARKSYESAAVKHRRTS